MGIDIPGGSKSNASASRENGLNLYPVSINSSGEGLPYAPEDWPNPGDNWGWKTGRRIAASGNFVDRYLYLPRGLYEAGQTKGFASKLSVKQYILENFPNADVDAFFSSFSWKIRSKAVTKGRYHFVVTLCCTNQILMFTITYILAYWTSQVF